MNKIQVEVVVNGSTEKVWQFWNEPEHITAWAFASDSWECPFAENNPVTGGTFVTRMAAKDGSASFDFFGTHTEVKEYEKISYVMSKDIHDPVARRCEVMFQAMSEGTTKVTEIFDAETENSEELQKNGWQSILNNFKKLVESTSKK